MSNFYQYRIQVSANSWKKTLKLIARSLLIDKTKQFITQGLPGDKGAYGTAGGVGYPGIKGYQGLQGLTGD